jgi:3-hydroxypropanoate dehydrogenase
MIDTRAIFEEAHTHNGWQDKPVPDDLLRRVYDIAKMGPTSANCSPMRVVFVKSPGAKAQLKPALNEGNVDKTMKAPVTAIIAYDTQFYDLLPRLYPQRDFRPVYANNPTLAQETAFRNGSMQGGYFIIAARASGLDCGPMSGFDNAKVDAEFFPDGRWKSNFLCNLGYGDPAQVRPRNPRPSFEEACRII